MSRGKGFSVCPLRNYRRTGNSDESVFDVCTKIIYAGAHSKTVTVQIKGEVMKELKKKVLDPSF